MGSRTEEQIEEVVFGRTRWWEAQADGTVVCRLCPRACHIHAGKAGFCAIRRNVGGRLAGLGYGRPSGFAVDPVEKKPLYHFLPGSRIFSFGTAGCNLACRFCQNWHLSRARVVERQGPLVSPEEVVRLAQQEGCPSIAFTYNEPTIFAEYAIDVARVAHEQGLHTVAVTAGYIAAGPRQELFAELDAANIDLKAMDDDFYHRFSRVRLAPVLETIAWVRRNTRCWVELTNLLIPGLNDEEHQLQALVDWVGETCGPDVPLHFSAFHPAGRMTDRPRTPARTLYRARELAQAAGLHHVYVGNVVDPAGAATRCPHCGTTVVERDPWRGAKVTLQQGSCPQCRQPVAGVWSDVPRRSPSTSVEH